MGSLYMACDECWNQEVPSDTHIVALFECYNAETADYMPDKELMSKISKELKYVKNSYNLVSKNSIKKQVEDLSRPLSKEDIQMANRHVKRCSNH